MITRSVGALFAALVASQAAGCVTTVDPQEFGYISATWQLKNVGGSPAPCPPGYNTAALYSQPVDANGNDVGQPYIDLFHCDAGAGESSELPAGPYRSWIAITTETNSAQFGSSLDAYVDITFEDKTFDVGIFLDGGYFQIDWGLKGAVTDRPLQCSQVGVTSLEIFPTLVTTAELADLPPVPCEEYSTITPVLPAGPYSVVLDAVGPGDILKGSIALPTQSIQPSNQVTQLLDPPYDVITIPIEGQ